MADQIPQQGVTQVRSNPTGKSDATARVCGECQACCNGWLAAEILGYKMGGGNPCHFLRPQGCSIYERRPELCRSFVCGWLKPDSPFPEDWRPDRSGFIIREGLWEGRRCWLLQHAGKDPSEEVMEVMRQHTIATGEPHIIKKLNSWLCYGKPEFQQAMLRLSQEVIGKAELKRSLVFW
jgi:hypothetical protein